jgi:hypothetical protein
VCVLALGLKWNSEAAPTAFPELQIPATMSPDATETEPFLK